jgi:hypothetical protein
VTQINVAMIPTTEMAQIENTKFSRKVRRLFGLDLHSWELIMLWSLGGAAVAALAVVVSTTAVVKLQKLELAELGKEAAEARRETAELQKVTAWRKLDERQIALISRAFSEQKPEGHFAVLNRDDPEQSQYFFKIATLCNKIKVSCRLHLRQSPFPFPPTGVMSFVRDDASDGDKLFVKTFKDAGVVTRELGLLNAAALFPPNVAAGIVIASKPDALEPWPFSTQSPGPAQ